MWDKYVNGIENDSPDPTITQKFDIETSLALVQFANNLLEKGLAVAPGEGFGEYKNFIRISACQNEKTLMEGMNILDNMMRHKQ